MELQECLTIDLRNARKRAVKVIKQTQDNEPLGSPQRLQRLSAQSLVKQVDAILRDRHESCQE